MKTFLRRLLSARPAAARPARRHRLRSVRPFVEALEVRVVPTTDLILDFDGGTLATGQGYDFPAGNGPGGGNTFTGFQGFAVSGQSGTADRTQQILQIVAGVRQNYADFDVRVIWDDRGIASPFYDGFDTVMMIVNDVAPPPSGGVGDLLGRAPYDINVNSRDVGIVWASNHKEATAGLNVSVITSTISHEAGHTFGLNHNLADQDALDPRAIMTTFAGNPNLDTRFSHVVMNREDSLRYAEYDRLQTNLGVAPAGTTLKADEIPTNLNLPQDTPLTDFDGVNLQTLNESIDHAGDRDAFQITFDSAGTFVIRQQAATGSPIAPAFSLWSLEGGFLGASPDGAPGGAAEMTYTAKLGETIFVVAGTTFDRLGSGETGTGQLGPYTVFVGPPGSLPPLSGGGGGGGGGGGVKLSGTVAVGADAGGAPEVRVIDLATGAPRLDFFAFDRHFTGGVRVARGDLTGDGIPDIIAAAGPGGGPHVRVFDGRDGRPITGPLGSFLAYAPNFHGGVYVAAADVNGDGFADIITGAGEGGGPHVRVFSGFDGSLLAEFMAYDAAFRGGVRVAAGDTNGDGKADIITGAGQGGGPHVEVFSGADGLLLQSLFPYDRRFRGGVFVAAGDINGDGRTDILTGPGSGGGAHLRAFNGPDGANLASISIPIGDSLSIVANTLKYQGGLRVAAVDVDGDGRLDMVAEPGVGAQPLARLFSGRNGALLGGFNAFDPSFLGGVFVS